MSLLSAIMDGASGYSASQGDSDWLPFGSGNSDMDKFNEGRTIVGGLGALGAAGGAGGASGWLGALIPGALDYAGQNAANKQNLQIAREQMSFQERMSNTAHEREVNDLRKAGLNPILSANRSGASTPQGASAVMQNALGKGVSTAVDAMRLQNESRLADGQIGLQTAQANAATAAATNSVATAKNQEAHTMALEAQMEAIKSEAKTRKGQAEWDSRMMKFDNLQRRIQNGLTTINTGKDAVFGQPRGVFKTSPKLRKNEMIINGNTGEVINEKY